jgi:transcriptional regulator with XRE-family HTH domain
MPKRKQMSLRMTILSQYETLGEFCAAMGMHPSVLSRLMKDPTYPMSLNRLAQISKALKVKPDHVVRLLSRQQKQHIAKSKAKVEGQLRVLKAEANNG